MRRVSRGGERKGKGKAGEGRGGNRGSV